MSKGGRPEPLHLPPKTARLMKLYEEDLHVRYGELTVKSYVGHVRAWLAWLVEQGGSVSDVRAEDLLAYQSALYGQKKRDGRPLLRGGADIRHIQALLGHASLQSTERYTRVEIQDLKDVIRRAHPRSR